MTKIGAEIYQLEKKKKELEDKKKELVESCQHQGDFVLENIADYDIFADDYKVAIKVKCKCSDCDKEFEKKFKNAKEYYKFRRNHLKGSFRKKDLDLLDFINDVFLENRKGTHNYRKSNVFWKAVDAARTGAELQTIFSGDFRSVFDFKKGASEFYAIVNKYAYYENKKSEVLDWFLYHDLPASVENYEKLKKCVDKIVDPSKKIQKNYEQWTSQHLYLSGNMHMFREVFRKTKTVYHDIIRVLVGSNHPRFVSVERKKDDDFAFTEDEKKETIKQAIAKYEEENGVKPDCLIVGMDGKDENMLDDVDGYTYKKGQIYMPSVRAENWGFGEYWSFMYECGKYNGLKVICAYEAKGGSIGPCQVIALREEELELNPDKPFPKVANYYLIKGSSDRYNGFFPKYSVK